MTIADNTGLGKTRETAAAEAQQMVLRETLRLAVPMHMVELCGLDPDHLAAIASHAATAIGSHGDALQYGGKHCREAFNALARGLAAAALTADGGVDYGGQHWCADPRCRATTRFDHANYHPATVPPPRASTDAPINNDLL